MDPYFSKYDDYEFDDASMASCDDDDPDPGEPIYLVSFGWWKQGVCGGTAEDELSGINGDLYNATGQLNEDSEISVEMWREEEEVSISGEEVAYGGEGDVALVPEWMFFTALKWHYDKKGMENSAPGVDSADDLFSLQIRLIYMRETRHLVIKISQKKNDHGNFNKACGVFFTKLGMLQVWDFSGLKNKFFLNDNLVPVDLAQSHEEILVELHVYSLPCSIIEKESSNDEVIAKQPSTNDSSSSSAVVMSGSVDKVNLFSAGFSVFNGTSALGLTGLFNIGNTCYMNSAVQCLVHTPNLVDYFLGNFRKDLNFKNFLGMKGKLAIAFGVLLRRLWAPRASTVTPLIFKSNISSFTPQFSGNEQHDSQEFLSFLLDGLHEDVNRVKIKPYIQTKEEDGRPDEEVAEEYWENHLSRNDSVIVDLFQGQYRSSLVCPVCKKLSVAFDPFMYLSLPLPSSIMRKMTLTVVSTDGTNLPHPVTVTVPLNGTFEDLSEALGKACSLRDDETLLIAEIYNDSILGIVNNPDGSMKAINDFDKFVAYRLPKDMGGCTLVEFMHQAEDKSYLHSVPTYETFGIPLVARISDFSKGSEIYKEFLKLISLYQLPKEFLNDDASRKCDHEDEEIKETTSDVVVNSKEEVENDLDPHSDFEFHMESGSYSPGLMIQMDKPVTISNYSEPIKVCVTWSEKMMQKYDTSSLSQLPAVCRTGFVSQWNHDSVSLYKCVDAFLKEEPLGPNDMWYCSHCKERKQANKKLDLWRLPEILVIHLKRFSHTRISNKKLETFVDFPVEDFDLSNYVLQKNSKDSCRYMLYAICNHYGGMDGGHYTAFAKHGLNRWYEFDDNNVNPITEEKIKTQAAYVLFYKRV